jgi:L,D-transpeptidase ErfK/SrfK
MHLNSAPNALQTRKTALQALTPAARLVALGLLLAAAGCQSLHRLHLSSDHAPPAFNEAAFARKSFASFKVATQKGIPVDTVIGKARTYRVREGDTFLDIARYYDLGYNEIVDANPGVDPWVPPVGTTIVLPTEWILPCCSYEGLVVNIPEMRLYLYRRTPGNTGTLIVDTLPVGLGRDDRRTPRGRFTVRGKTVNPTWIIPQSIRAEHIEETGDTRTKIPGGDPDNPLGKYRLELTLPRYTIHGTNIPWGVGMQVSHGCARLYPEDIERLYPLVPVGMRGEFTYQAVKVGTRGGATYAEVHRDIYRYVPKLRGAALAALKRRGLGGQIDETALSTALREERGIPVQVSRGRGIAALLRAAAH